MISSDIVEYSHKLLRGADFGAGIPVYGADAAHDGFGFSIIKMPAVPGQEIIDTMDSRDGNVEGVIIAVGRPVTRPPPHRSRRAELPHRALQRDSLAHAASPQVMTGLERAGSVIRGLAMANCFSKSLNPCQV